MGYILDIDTKKCSSCGACAIACMDQNDIDVAGGILPFRTVFDWEGQEGAEHRHIYVSIACMHCAAAPCVAACPCGCIQKDGETGFTVYNTDNCISCHSCAMACPFGAPSFGKDGKMHKCDGCIERVRHGMEPSCVRVCPTGALRLLREEEWRQWVGQGSLQKIGEEYLHYQR